MKKLLLPLLLLAASLQPATAQETFAPLITENTAAFVHLDLRKADLDTVKAEAVKQSENLLKQLNFDSKSAKAVLRELHAELGKAESIARPIAETVLGKLGINEIAWFSDLALIDSHIGGAVIALPWKNKTAADLETLRKLLPEDSPKESIYPLGNFLIVPIMGGWNPKRDHENLTNWHKALEPAADCAIQQALKSLKKEDEIKYAFAVPGKVKEMAGEDRFFLPGAPKEILNLFVFIAKKVDWAAGSVSFADLLNTDGKKEDDKDTERTILTVKTPKASEARQLRIMLEGTIDWGVAAGQFAASANGGGAKVPPLAFELLKGFLRTLLPDVEEDRLIFKLRKSITGLLGSKESAAGIAGLGTALLLPAVQAARETAQKQRCMNNLHMIVLAFHNYYAAYEALPPLYTVDKNGKPLHSWRVLLLPFLEQPALYDKIRLDEPWDSDHNKQFHNADVPFYRCPDRHGKAGECHYSVIAGEVLKPAKKAGEVKGSGFDEMTDGTSNTLAVVEVKEAFCWMDPKGDVTMEELLKGINTKEGRVGSPHNDAKGGNAAIWDGSVRFLQNALPKDVLRKFADPDDGEVIELD